MKLSDLNVSPKYPVVIPSTGKRTTFRPFVVKEERALLSAQESEDVNVMITTMEAVVKQCVDKCPDRLTSYDLEYLITMIRAKSVGEFSDLIFKCDSCNDPAAKTPVRLDLTKVQISKQSHSGKVKLNDNLTAILKYPSVEDLLQVNYAEDKEHELMKVCIDKLVTQEETFVLKEETEDEVNGFMSTLTSKQKSLIDQFIQEVPYTYIDVHYTCPVCKTEHSKQIKGINNFF
jgi:hypothetical protein